MKPRDIRQMDQDEKLDAIRRDREAGKPWSSGGMSIDRQRLDVLRGRVESSVQLDPRRRPTVSAVMYIADPNTGRVKITCSRRPARRLLLLQEGNPDLTLEAQEDGGPELRRQRHREFAQYRVVKDWFSAEQPLLDHMVNLSRDGSTVVHAPLKPARPKVPRPPGPPLPGAEGVTRIGLAREFLSAILSEGMVSLEVLRDAAAEVGLSWKLVEHAKHDLEVESVKTKGFPARVVGWRLPGTVVPGSQVDPAPSAEGLRRGDDEPGSSGEE